MATMWPFLRRMSTRWTLCSGATRAMTPMSSICRTASSSDIAANSAPVSARPSMPSWVAMAWAVTAWSPVIMRTRMPACFALAIASLGLRPRRVDDAHERSSVRSVTSGSMSAAGSKVAGSKSRWAVAMTRRPCSPSRSFSAMKASRIWSSGHRRAVRAVGLLGTRQQLVRRALDVGSG